MIYLDVPKRYEGASWNDVPSDVRMSVKGLLDPTADRRGLYLWGGVGVGKTHIAWAVAKGVQRSPLVQQVRFYNVVDLMDRIRDSYRDAEDDFDVADYEGLLILDDMGAEKTTEWVVEQLYFVVNYRYENNLPLMVTSNHSPAELADRVGKRIASRLVEMSHVIELTGGDRRLYTKHAKEKKGGK